MEVADHLLLQTAWVEVEAMGLLRGDLLRGDLQVLQNLLLLVGQRDPDYHHNHQDRKDRDYHCNHPGRRDRDYHCKHQENSCQGGHLQNNRSWGIRFLRGGIDLPALAAVVTAAAVDAAAVIAVDNVVVIVVDAVDDVDDFAKLVVEAMDCVFALLVRSHNAVLV